MSAFPIHRFFLSCTASFLLLGCATLVAQSAPPQTCSVPAGDILRIMLSGPMNVAKLEPGTRLEGEVMRSIYVVDREAIPAGTRVEAIVEKVDREKLNRKKQNFLERVGSFSSPHRPVLDAIFVRRTPNRVEPAPVAASLLPSGGTDARACPFRAVRAPSPA